MGRKWDNNFVDLGSSEDSDDIDILDGFESLPDSDNEYLHESQYSGAGDDESLKRSTYKQILKDYAELKHLKKKFELALSRQEGNNKRVSKPKDAFTRFSASNFSSVIESLSPENKMVIDNYGFGSLLMFDKCFVPNRFVKWVARLVNPRSADIVFSGKVISLTKESVNLILGVPISQNPFPADYSTGKSIVLSKFNKQSIPTVNFFAKKITDHEPLSDEDLIICFLVVALNTFLCPNSSVTPCYKYFGIFQDVGNARELDWSGYVLDWLLQGIKTFNSAKSFKAYDGGTLPGCLYYLAVLYLDHIDFGDRHIPQSIPRISVWKGSMIQKFAELDTNSQGCYGFHPLLDTSRTCYSKDFKHLYNPHSPVLNSDFHEKLEQYSGCKLPEDLKVSICKLIESYCLNSGLSINLDVSCVSSLPDEMKITFCKLLQHAYSIDTRAQKLVLDLMDIVSKSVSADDVGIPSDGIFYSGQVRSHQEAPHISHTDIPESSNRGQYDGDSPVSSTHFEVQTSNQHLAHATPPDMPQDNRIPPNATSETNLDDHTESDHLPMPNLRRHALKTPANLNNVDVARVMQKLTKKTPIPSSTLKNTSSEFQIKSSADHSTQPVCRTLYKFNLLSQVKSEKGDTETKRTPLADLSNDRSSKKLKKSVSFGVDDHNNHDVILLDCENMYVPDSISPASIPGKTRYCSKKLGIPKFNESLPSSSETVEYNKRTPEKSIFNHPNKVCHSSSKHVPTKVSPEVQILAETTLAESVLAMSKKSDAMYNRNMRRSQDTFCTTTNEVPAKGPCCLHQLSTNIPTSVSYKVRDSSNDGRLPNYGPKRLVQPGPLFKGDHVTNSRKFIVSESEIENYQNICRLALSQYQGDDAVYLYGVRCTFWSLGDSLKPSGHVNPFVVAVFCYSLFHKPSGHPDISNRHYFFPNISDNLLKDFNAADQDVLSRAFKRSSKARPLINSNILFFPTFYDEHWFVFVVDIKDRKFVMLDSLFSKDEHFQQYVSNRMRASFQHHWRLFIKDDVDFEDWGFIYPAVPQQPSGHEHDSGIYAMMFLEYWASPRTSLTSVFTPKDIPNIRIKIANELVFQPKNSGMKHRVTQFQVEDD
ncbi:unnamed protein product [Urochloa decumbens]|uniref:Ubiquitin-like protease family profile domain-containing protein n=1 Tax=Urochloa decumbens TaxID=240449 RepID=A0ABC8ZEW7_9POAL